MAAEITVMPFGDGDEIERSASSLVEEIYSGTAEQSERSAVNIVVLAKQGPDQRRILLDSDVIRALGSMCTRDNEARTQAHGSLGLASMASNFASYVMAELVLERIDNANLIHIFYTTELWMKMKYMYIRQHKTQCGMRKFCSFWFRYSRPGRQRHSKPPLKHLPTLRTKTH